MTNSNHKPVETGISITNLSKIDQKKYVYHIGEKHVMRTKPVFGPLE